MSFESENDRLKNENQEQQLKLEKQTKTIQRLTERSKTLQKALRQFKKESSTKEQKLRALLSTNATEMDKKLQDVQTLNDANQSYQQNRVTMDHNIQTLQQQMFMDVLKMIIPINLEFLNQELESQKDKKEEYERVKNNYDYSEDLTIEQKNVVNLIMIYSYSKMFLFF